MTLPVLTGALLLLQLAAAPALSAQDKVPDVPRLVPGARYVDARKMDLSRLPDPPALGSLAAQADLETILQLQAWRTDAEVAWAKATDRLQYFDVASTLGPWFRPDRLPLTARLLKDVLGDGESANHVAKLKWKRLRPCIQDARVQPCVQPPKETKTNGQTDPGFYSYPSGHATAVYLTANVLADLMPAHKDAVFAWARKAAWGRMLAGVHYPSDNLGGRILAGLVHDAVKANPEYRKAVEACQAELRAQAPAGTL